MTRFLCTLFISVCLSVPMQLKAQEFKLGADLSYTNQLEDCGALYYANDGVADPFVILADKGSQVARFRLWHNSAWTDYSTFDDVKRSIQRAKNAGMAVLLDFHYSDTWADPAKQERPAAWKGITDVDVLADSVYQYTKKVLTDLKDAGLMPEYVQIGNETNGNILCDDNEELFPLNWTRQVKLMKAGIKAVNETNADTKTVLHVADPKNGDWWFTQAKSNGLDNFDIIGLSYYPEFHDYTLSQVGDAVKNLKNKFTKAVWIVETGYPWTLANDDAMGNILGAGSILSGQPNPPTAESQKNFLINLTYMVKKNGGMGVIYWEPTWVAAGCPTLWGNGSSYDNATFFDFDNKLLPAVDFFTYDYSVEPTTSARVTFMVDATGVDATSGIFVTGDFTGTEWKFMNMSKQSGNIYSYTTNIEMGAEGAYIFTNKGTWDNWTTANQETVPAACAVWWNTHRGYAINNDTITYAFGWGSCEPLVLSNKEKESGWLKVCPNPVNDILILELDKSSGSTITIYDSTGREVLNTLPDKDKTEIDVSHLWPGVFIVKCINGNQQQTIQFIKE